LFHSLLQKGIREKILVARETPEKLRGSVHCHFVASSRPILTSRHSYPHDVRSANSNIKQFVMIIIHAWWSIKLGSNQNSVIVKAIMDIDKKSSV
jgi:hypothetical protein